MHVSVNTLKAISNKSSAIAEIARVVLVKRSRDKGRTDGTAMAIEWCLTRYTRAKSETVECDSKTLLKRIHRDLRMCCKFNATVNSEHVTKMTATPLNRPQSKTPSYVYANISNLRAIEPKLLTIKVLNAVQGHLRSQILVPMESH